LLDVGRSMFDVGRSSFDFRPMFIFFSSYLKSLTLRFWAQDIKHN